MWIGYVRHEQRGEVKSIGINRLGWLEKKIYIKNNKGEGKIEVIVTELYPEVKSEPVITLLEN